MCNRVNLNGNNAVADLPGCDTCLLHLACLITVRPICFSPLTLRMVCMEKGISNVLRCGLVNCLAPSSPAEDLILNPNFAFDKAATSTPCKKKIKKNKKFVRLL
jgi:hypothetical protein